MKEKQKDAKPKGGWLKQLYYAIVKTEKFLGNFVLLIIRLYWGCLSIIIGIGKFMNISGVSEFFMSFNIPYPIFMAYFVASIELIGGLSLVLGLYSRIFSIVLTTLFLSAYGIVYHDSLMRFLLDPTIFISQDPFLYLYASIIVLCFGPGFISIDYWLEKRAYGKAL